MDEPHIDHWSPEEAIRYDEFAAQSFSWLYIEKPSLQGLIEPHITHQTVALDLGCGGGRIIELLRQVGVAEASIYGLDSNPTLLNMTRERFPGARVLRGELTEAPYADIPAHTVDLVTAHLVLQYLGTDELSACLREVHRLLKLGGYLTIGLPHPIRVNEQADADYFARRRQIVGAPWGGVTASSGLTIADYFNATIDAGFRLCRVAEPEISDDGFQHEEAGNYSPGPTRLMMLMQAGAYSM
jgi:ubiquinone/menaquinone biosynthesis C-methylase UbiE